MPHQPEQDSAIGAVAAPRQRQRTEQFDSKFRDPVEALVGLYLFEKHPRGAHGTDCVRA